MFSSDYVVNRVLSEKNDFWISVDKDNEIKGCIVIEALNFPNSAGVSVEALGGSFNFSTVVPMLEDYYKSLGFKFVELTGRAGWEKRMKPLGYEFVSVTIRKKI